MNTKYTNFKLEKEIVSSQGIISKNEINYLELKNEIDKNHLSINEMPKIIKIGSGELNIFIYRKEINKIRQLIEKATSAKFELYMQNKILVDRVDREYKHEMVNAINLNDNKNIFITNKKIPVQFILLDNILYIYGFHTRFQLNYQSLSNHEKYKHLENLRHYGDLRDIINVTRLELNNIGLSVLNKYLNTLNDDDNLLYHVTAKNKFNIDEKPIIKVEKSIEDMVNELENHYINTILLMQNDKLSIDEFKTKLPKSFTDSIVNKIYNKYCLIAS